MKKKIISFSLILSGVFLFACNDNKNSSSTTSTDTTTTSSTNMGTTTTDTAATRSTMSANNLSDKDKSFMNEAASGGMMEVELGRVAAQNASSERVKNFGNMMVQDHTNANNELKALASGKNVMLSDSMMSKHRMHVDMMKKKTGKDFDKAYMSMMVTDHNEDISKFQATANNAQDADLKAFANKTLPVLRTHLDSAKAVNSGIRK